MTNNLFSFKWGKLTGGYIVSDFEKPLGLAVFTDPKKRKQKIQIISGKGKKGEWYSPLKENNLHRTFVDMACSPEGVLNFVKEYGFLGVPTKYFKKGEKYYEEIDVIIKARNELSKTIDYMNESFALVRKIERTKKHMIEERKPVNNEDPHLFDQIAGGLFNQWASGHMQRMRVMLEPIDIGNKKRLTWKVVPDTLLSAMWLITAEEIMRGKTKGARTHRLCQVCNKLIPEGARIDKITCSNTCRRQYNRIKQRT